MRYLAALLVALLLVAQLRAVEYTIPFAATAVEVQNGGSGGSATLVGVNARGKGLCLTCWHVFEGGIARPTVRFAGEDKWYAARVLATDQELDLAAMECGLPPKPRTACRVRAVAKSDGELIAIGFPYYAKVLDPYITRGRFLAMRGADCYFAAKPTVHSGFSGGGLFAPDGSLVGVIHGYTDRQESLATSGRQLESFVARWLKQ